MINKKIFREHEYFLSILNTIPHGIYIVSQQYDIQYINSAIECDFGPVSGQKCYQYFHERTEACPWCKNDTVFSGKSVRWEWYSKKTGTYFDLYDSPITNPDGTISKLEIFIDITELKNTEKEHEQAKEVLRRYEQIIEATDDLMAFLDQNYVYQAVNKAYLEAHQKTLQDIVGHSVADLLGTDLFEQSVKKQLDRCFAGDEIHYQAWFSFPGMRQRYMDVSYYPFLDSNSEVTGVVVSSHDITDSKQAKRALQDSNVALKVLVEQQQNNQHELEQQILAKLKKLVFPYLDQLQNSLKEDAQGQQTIAIIGRHLSSLTDSFTRKITDPLLNLSQREVLVADLVRQGKSTQEIADLLSLSLRTIEAYRMQLRKKLGLRTKKENLYRHLNSNFVKE